MDRINSNYMASLSPGSRRAFQDVNGTTVPNGTQVNAAFLNGVQEELLAVQEAAGLTASGSNNAQVLQGIRRLAAANYTSLVQSVVGSTVTLTADNAGRIAVDATAGNMTITLPLAAAGNGTVAAVATVNSLQFEIYRVDNSSFTVTLVKAGSDSIAFGGVNSSGLVLPALTQAFMFSDGVSSWLTAMPPATVQAPAQVYWATAGSRNWTVPPGVTSIRATLCGAGGGGGGTKNSGDGATGGAGSSEATFVLTVAPGEVLTVNTGAGGTAGTGGNPPTNGGAGGATSIVRSGVTLAAVSGGGAGLASNAAGLVTTANTAGAVTTGTAVETKVGSIGGLPILITGTTILLAQGGAPWNQAQQPSVGSGLTNGGGNYRPGGGGMGGINGGAGGAGADGFARIEY